MSTYEAKDAKLSIGGVEFPITEVTHSYDSENGHREERLLGPSPAGPFTIECTGVMTEEFCEYFRWLGFRLLPGLGYTGDYFMRSCACVASAVEHKGVGRAMLGRNAWVVIGEQQTPTHRRFWMAQYWHKALAPRYWVNSLDADGKPTGGVRGFYVAGNQREVLEVYDRIRKEAGDFDVEEVGGLN